VRRAAGGAEAGVTLIELTMALLILSVVLLGMGAFAVQFAQTVTRSESRTVAVELAAQRLAEVRADPNYDGLEATYATTEPTIAGFPRYTRQTTVRRTGGPAPLTVDYKTVTVSITAPGLRNPVTLTAVVAPP
jgi:Tfp pilus assembly protein PilV